MGITVDYAGLTDIGRVRRHNEDQFLIAELDKALQVVQTSLSEGDRRHLSGTKHGTIFLVADGMGGRSGGEVASGVAAETLARYALHTMPWFFQLRDGREPDLEHELVAAIEACQRSVQSTAAATGHTQMGTTLTIAYLLWPRLYVVHAGDSRCYILRQGTAQQVTRDHTVAERMVEQGLMTPEQAAESKWSHALVKCVGGGKADVNPDVYKATLHPGDTLLLCSDGLSKYVDQNRLVELVDRAESAEAACRRLVDAANEAGGSDNVTVIVARISSDGPPATVAETAVLPAVA